MQDIFFKDGNVVTY